MKYFFPGLSVRHPLALVALLGPFAQAQDFHWGVHFGAISPQGDLGKAVGQSPGLGGDLHLLMDSGGAHALRFRLAGMNFGQGAHSAETYVKARAAAGAVDYLYFFEGTTTTGFYLTVGPDWTRWHTETVNSSMVSLREDKNSLGGTLGCGYQFNRLTSAELSTFWSRFREENGSALGITLGFTLRF